MKFVLWIQKNYYILPNLNNFLHRSYSKLNGMRTIKLAAGIFLIMLSCCGKPGTGPFLQLSQTEVSRGEPLTAQVFNGPEGGRIVWQFPYNAHVLKYYVLDSNYVNLTFSDLENSTKEICVRVYDGPNTDTTYTTLCKEIKVTSERFAPPAPLPADRVESLAGDQLTLQPVIYPTDSTLNFIVETKNWYSCMNSYVNYNNASVENSNVSIAFTGVWMPYSCVGAKIWAVSLCSTYSYYKDGNYPIEIAFNNKVYKGSVTVSQYQRKYEFNWPYTEGIVIEPKVLERP